MKQEQQNKILSISFITSVSLLLLNDFCLKSAFPGIITGKLSDFAGLFSFPLFLSALFPKKKIPIYATTAIAFIFWKSPLASNFIYFVNQYAPYSIGRVVDYTDYFALVVLPLSYLYKPYKVAWNKTYIKKAAMYCVSFIAVFSFLATAGTHGNIKAYTLDYSKSQVDNALLTFYQKYPKFKIPDEYESYTWHYGDRNSPDKWIQQANADSVSFHFYNENEKIVYWTGFSGFADNWNSKTCELLLIGYIKIGEKWKFISDMNKKGREKVTNYFESEILLKLEEILNRPPGVGTQQ